MSKVIVTPVGKAVYPHLQNPDTRFNDNGVYQCRLHVDEAGFTEFSAQVNELYEKAYKAECGIKDAKVKKAESFPLRVTDEGSFEIYAKQEALKQTKTKGLLQFRVAAYNAKGTKIQMPPVGSGSELKMAVEPHFWNVSSQGFGMTLRLRSVQIIALKEFSADDTPFASVDGFAGGEAFTNELTNDETPQVSKEANDDAFSF
tara:strand:+ start:1033 stop:1638 length:606 start_codon:yes stop_codon:yes gene_type:complete